MSKTDIKIEIEKILQQLALLQANKINNKEEYNKTVEEYNNVCIQLSILQTQLQAIDMINTIEV